MTEKTTKNYGFYGILKCKGSPHPFLPLSFLLLLSSPSPPLPSPLFPSLSLPSLLLRAAIGVWGSAVSSPSRVNWGEAYQSIRNFTRRNNIASMQMNTVSDSPELVTAMRILWIHTPVCIQHASISEKRGAQKQASLKVLKSGGPSLGAYNRSLRLCLLDDSTSSLTAFRH